MDQTPWASNKQDETTSRNSAPVLLERLACSFFIAIHSTMKYFMPFG